LKHNIFTFFTLTAIVLSSVIFWESGLALYVIPILTAMYVAVIAYGSWRIQANYYLTSINKGKSKSIALTFDDGPDPVNTPKILDTLQQYNIKATFFVIGKKAEQFPELLKRIDEEGHTIGNHSYGHSYLIGFYTSKALYQDIERCNDVIMQIIGKKPQYFRPPFGVTNPNYADAMKGLNLQSIGWSLRSMDTRAKNKYQVIEKVISRVQKKDIVLFHDRLACTAEALPDIIEHFQNKKLTIEPLSSCIKLEPYANI
jgi:peptidoglycan/xylan/chitin deacetylase (PgdA/CDA1 family)